MGVGGRDVDEHRIQDQDARAEQLGHVREEDRDVVCAPLVHRRPGVGSDEKCAMPEAGHHVGGEVRPGTLGVQVDDAHITQVGGAGNQGVEERRGGGRAAMDEYLLAGSNAGDGLLGRDDAHAPSMRGTASVDGRSGSCMPRELGLARARAVPTKRKAAMKPRTCSRRGPGASSGISLGHATRREPVGWECPCEAAACDQKGGADAGEEGGQAQTPVGVPRR